MKNKIRFVVFIIVFAVLFACVQYVFVPKNHIVMQSPAETFVQFYNEPKNSFDVLFLGPSGILTAFLPSVIWEDTGVSSYNLAMSGTRGSVMYYWLKEALQYQSPKLLVISERPFFSYNNFDDLEPRIRQAMDDMRWSKNKIDSVMDILAHSEKQKFMDYLFPLLRYHDRKDITRNDYSVKFRFERSPTMSAYTYLIHEERIMPVDFWDINRANEFVFDDEYMLKIVAVCRKNNIELVIASTPTTENNIWSIKKHIAVKNWASVHGVLFLDYNMQDMREATNLDESRDFADFNHVNLLGAPKISRHFARYIAEEFNLPDRRTAEYDSYWDTVVSTYHNYYNNFAEEIKTK